MSISEPEAVATGAAETSATEAPTRGRQVIHRARDLVVRYWIEAIPTAVALALAWREFRTYRHDGLFPDTLDFLAHANAFPYDSIWGGFREPVWTTLLAGPVALFGHDDLVAKSLSVAGFFSLVLSVQLVARWLHGRVAGLVAGLAIAGSPFLVYWSVSGLREEAAAATIVVFGGLVCRKPATRRAWLWLVAYVGLLAMFRWDTTTLTIPVLIVALVLVRADWRTILLCAVLFGAIISPLVVGNAVRNDDPLYHSNVHARFYRDYEFGQQPGFSPRETWLQYVFDRHTLGVVVHRLIEAPVVVPLRMAGLGLFGFQAAPVPDATWPNLGTLGDNKLWMPWLLFAGGIFGAVALIRRGRWPFAMLLGLASVQHFPVVHLPGYDYRLEIVVYPLLILANLECVMWLIDRVRSSRPRDLGADAKSRTATEAPWASARADEHRQSG